MAGVVSYLLAMGFAVLLKLKVVDFNGYGRKRRRVLPLLSVPFTGRLTATEQSLL